MKAINGLALFAAAAVSTVVSYVGLSYSMPADTLYWLLLAAFIAAGVGICIFAFWHNAFEAAINPERFRFRSAGWIATLIGSVMLIGMSSWWNVSAIGRKDAEHAALYSVLGTSQVALANAKSAAVAHKPFSSRIDGFAADIAALSECEKKGCVSGTSGGGGVSETLRQLSDKASGVASAISASDGELTQAGLAGNQCLSEMSSILEGQEDVDELKTALSPKVDCINAAIATLTGNGQLARIAQEMEHFTTGLVLPNSIRSDNQKQAVGSALEGLARRAKLIAMDAREAQQSIAIAPITIPRQSAMLSVIIYCKSILPAWITGISLDLLPALLMFFQATIKGDVRHRPESERRYMVRDLQDALSLAETLREQLLPPAQPLKTINASPAPQPISLHQITYTVDQSIPAYKEISLVVSEQDPSKPDGTV